MAKYKSDEHSKRGGVGLRVGGVLMIEDVGQPDHQSIDRGREEEGLSDRRKKSGRKSIRSST